jgi:hypothetical protein
VFEDLQQIILYVKADSTVGEIVDEYGQSTSVTKAITRGVEALLCLRVLRDGDAYPFEQLSSFVACWITTGILPQPRNSGQTMKISR